MKEMWRESKENAPVVASSRYNAPRKRKQPNGIVAAEACDDLCLEVVAAPAKANHACLGELDQAANDSDALVLGASDSSLVHGLHSQRLTAIVVIESQYTNIHLQLFTSPFFSLAIVNRQV
jgi:hypothetical protein